MSTFYAASLKYDESQSWQNRERIGICRHPRDFVATRLDCRRLKNRHMYEGSNGNRTPSPIQFTPVQFATCNLPYKTLPRYDFYHIRIVPQTTIALCDVCHLRFSPHTTFSLVSSMKTCAPHKMIDHFHYQRTSVFKQFAVYCYCIKVV